MNRVAGAEPRQDLTGTDPGIPPAADANGTAACANSAADSARSLRIGGLVPMSTVDWPGQLAAVLFLQGCPWRCTYCHNPDLQPACGDDRITWSDVEALLKQRVGLLDGVVFSGGEPTAQAALVDAVARVHELGFACALHTAGIHPARIARLLPQLDWIALDIKTTPENYDALTATPGSASRVFETLDRVIASGKPFECRTTVDWNLLPPEALLRLAEDLAARGVTNYAVQIARGIGDYRPSVAAAASERVLELISTLFQNFSVRR